MNVFWKFWDPTAKDPKLGERGGRSDFALVRVIREYFNRRYPGGDFIELFKYWREVFCNYQIGVRFVQDTNPGYEVCGRMHLYYQAQPDTEYSASSPLYFIDGRRPDGFVEIVSIDGLKIELVQLLSEITEDVEESQIIWQPF